MFDGGGEFDCLMAVFDCLMAMLLIGFAPSKLVKGFPHLPTGVHEVNFLYSFFPTLVPVLVEAVIKSAALASAISLLYSVGYIHCPRFVCIAGGSHVV